VCPTTKNCRTFLSSLQNVGADISILDDVISSTKCAKIISLTLRNQPQSFKMVILQINSQTIYQHKTSNKAIGSCFLQVDKVSLLFCQRFQNFFWSRTICGSRTITTYHLVPGKVNVPNIIRSKVWKTRNDTNATWRKWLWESIMAIFRN